MERNLSREAHIWYTITSPEYMDRARDHLQDAFDFLVKQVDQQPIVTDYPPLPYWAGKMENLLKSYDNARAILAQGEFAPMIAWGGGLETIPRGFDEGVRWMSDDDYDTFKDKLDNVVGVCGDFWDAVVMSQMYCSDGYKDGTADWQYEMPRDMGPDSWFVLLKEERIFPELPAQIPEYAADRSLSCKTGEIVPWTGVWVPSMGMGMAALAFARQGLQIMQPAYKALRINEDEFDVEEYKLVECTWHPVRPTGRMIPHPALAERAASNGASARLRCPAIGS
jgi:hypothetical protein